MAASPVDELVSHGEATPTKSSKSYPAVADTDSRVSHVKDEQSGDASRSPSLDNLKLESSRPSSSASNRSRSNSDSKPRRNTRQTDSGKGKSTPIAKNARYTKKATIHPPTLYADLPNATKDATSNFTVIDKCTYSNKWLGWTEHAMECDCTEDWHAKSGTNRACGDESDCINRVTKMECSEECGCGAKCQNQRFQQQQYANVSVIKTEKKGFGLRTDAALRSGDFIFEYIGEVINEKSFRQRMVQYDDEGIIHFYFMSLSKGEFVDATKKGNLGRFCNHSCSPNCYVDKWVVGDKLRMGIFAERNIQAGEELVFNYNVDRYGANPQPCYCGEPNCTGFIGGKTQTERGTKLSAATIEALGIDSDDDWDFVAAKKPRKRKTGEDDEEYVEGVDAKSLDPDGVTKVMAALMQCKEKWIAVKLLARIQNAHDEQVRARVIKLHGYQILNSQLAAWKEDANLVLQIFAILNSFPRLTRNKIQDSKIEGTVEGFAENEDERVVKGAKYLIDEWSKLEVAYRIPRKKRDPNETAKKDARHYERREAVEERKPKSRTPTPPRAPAIPSGPRGGPPQRINRPRPRKDELPWGWYEGRTKKGFLFYYSMDGWMRQRPNYPPRQPMAPPPPMAQLEDPECLRQIMESEKHPVPMGWQTAKASNGRIYYFNHLQYGWIRPNVRSEPDDISQGKKDEAALKNVIAEIVAAQEKEEAELKAKRAAAAEPPKVKEKVEKWRSYDEEKKKKLYKNTIHPVVCHVMNKYQSKLPKEELKRFAKEAADKLVNSDFKSGRVEDPTKIDEKREKKIKKFCQEYFDKGLHKYRKYQKDKAARKKKAESSKKGEKSAVDAKAPAQETQGSQDVEQPGQDADDVHMSMDELDMPSPVSPTQSIKRARDDDDELDMETGSQSPRKKAKASPVQRDIGHSLLKWENSVSPVGSVSPTGSLKRKFEDDVDSPVVDSPLKKHKIESPRQDPSMHKLPSFMQNTFPKEPDIDEQGVARRDPDRVSLDHSRTSSDGHIHADSSYAQKSMADILAEAQQASRTPSDEEKTPSQA